MENRLLELIREVITHQGSDLHLFWEKEMVLEYRRQKEMVPLQKIEGDERLFAYLAYISRMDISDRWTPQSGSFEREVDGKLYSFRYAALESVHKKSGVLRILNYHQPLSMEQLVLKGEHRRILKNWCEKEHGLLLVSGPTGSGKTTTLYSLLYQMRNRKVYTLEDPVEIYQEHCVQIQVNPQMGMTYEEGIRQLLRHDPDVIMIGEIRDELTAKMAIRCALTGHLVISSIHAASASGTIARLYDLNITRAELEETLAGIANQRLFPLRNHARMISLYEIYDRYDIAEVLNGNRVMKCMEEEIEYAVQKRWIEPQKNIHG